MSSYICKFCNKTFDSKKGCKTRQPKFCSIECYGQSLKLNKQCKLCGKIIENKHSVSLKNRIYCSVECRCKATKGNKLSDTWKLNLSLGRKKSEKCKGENLYNWKGGKETFLIRAKGYFYKRKKSLKLDMPVEFLQKLLAAQNNKCFFCDTELTNYKAIEHLTPITKGGDNEIFNLVYSCKKCNSQKRQQTLEQFALNTKRDYLIDKWEKIFMECI